MISLVFDTETTGFPKNNYQEGGQGRLIQFWGALYEHDLNKSYIQADEQGRMVNTARPFASLSTIIDVQTDVPQKAYDVHKIDRATAERLGVDSLNAACLIEDFVDIADRLVCHNKLFDIRILKHFFWNYDRDVGLLDSKDVYCTMRKLKPVMRLTPKKYGDWKFPSLQESYNYLFDRDFEGSAHDAAVDGMAAADIYFGILHMGELYGD